MILSEAFNVDLPPRNFAIQDLLERVLKHRFKDCDFTFDHDFGKVTVRLEYNGQIYPSAEDRIKRVELYAEAWSAALNLLYPACKQLLQIESQLGAESDCVYCDAYPHKNICPLMKMKDVIG